MFLYMHEYERGHIKNEETLNKNIGLTISCGSFSYAKMIERFENIFGVSGTL